MKLWHLTRGPVTPPPLVIREGVIEEWERYHLDDDYSPLEPLVLPPPVDWTHALMCEEEQP